MVFIWITIKTTEYVKGICQKKKRKKKMKGRKKNVLVVKLKKEARLRLRHTLKVQSPSLHPVVYSIC